MYELLVEGMSCGHCVGAVTRSVKEVDDAATVEVDLATQKVKIASTAALADLAAAVEEAGYPVKSSSAA